jgi:hypothetical protein
MKTRTATILFVALFILFALLSCITMYYGAHGHSIARDARQGYIDSLASAPVIEIAFRWFWATLTTLPFLAWSGSKVEW